MTTAKHWSDRCRLREIRPELVAIVTLRPRRQRDAERAFRCRARMNRSRPRTRRPHRSRRIVAQAAAHDALSGRARSMPPPSTAVSPRASRRCRFCEPCVPAAPAAVTARGPSMTARRVVRAEVAPRPRARWGRARSARRRSGDRGRSGTTPRGSRARARRPQASASSAGSSPGRVSTRPRGTAPGRRGAGWAPPRRHRARAGGASRRGANATRRARVGELSPASAPRPGHHGSRT